MLQETPPLQDLQSQAISLNSFPPLVLGQNLKDDAEFAVLRGSARTLDMQAQSALDALACACPDALSFGTQSKTLPKRMPKHALICAPAELF